MILFADITQIDSMGILCEAGERALERAQAAQRAGAYAQTAAYLRATITCARQMHQRAKDHPNFWRHAVMLLNEVIDISWQCEDQLFTQGKATSARFITILVQASGLRMVIADAVAEAQIEDAPEELAQASMKQADEMSAATGRTFSASSFYAKPAKADAPAPQPLHPTPQPRPAATAAGG